MERRIHKEVGKLRDWSRKEIAAHNDWLGPELKMALLSRSFIRKRGISLATTVSFGAISFALARDPTCTKLVGAAMPVQYMADRSLASEQQAFLSESGAAIKKAMTKMPIQPAGDADRDFLAMLVPYRRGAVDMATAKLKCGNSQQVRRLARELVATQRQEIGAIRDVVSAERSSKGRPRAESSFQADLTGGSVIPGG